MIQQCHLQIFAAASTNDCFSITAASTMIAFLLLPLALILPFFLQCECSFGCRMVSFYPERRMDPSSFQVPTRTYSNHTVFIGGVQEYLLTSPITNKVALCSHSIAPQIFHALIEGTTSAQVLANCIASALRSRIYGKDRDVAACKIQERLRKSMAMFS